MSDYGLVILDSESEDVGEVIALTDELRKNPTLLKEKIEEVIKKHEEENKEDEDKD